MDGYKNSEGESQMSIVLTKEGWKVLNPTVEELASLVELGKEEVVRQASIQSYERQDFLTKLDEEKFFRT
jgi:hypothetical protein